MEIIPKLFRMFYWPLCRTYAKHLGDRPADTLMRLMCSPPFWMLNGYWPNFVSPRSFSEKLWSKQLHDRDPRLTLITDKLRVRDYVASKIGDKHLIPLLWHGDKPEEIPFDQLAAPFVLKTNDSCGTNIFVTDKNKIVKNNIISKLSDWLHRHADTHYLGVAWGYKNIKRTIIAEKFIGENDKAPTDYKFYCFSGSVEFLSLHIDRFEEHKTQARDRDFNPYDLRYDLQVWNGQCQKPAKFEEMVSLAETLSEDFDFMRVDLYCVGENIYFGELTPYPGGVSARFLPLERDYILGEKWKDFKINVN